MVLERKSPEKAAKIEGFPAQCFGHAIAFFRGVTRPQEIDRMRLKYVAFAVLLPLLLLAPHATFADTLTLTGVGGANTDGVYTYPYEFTVTNASGTSTDVLMSCLKDRK